ncbi:ABC transporter ATP-binding protein/permease [Phycicoccus sp. MAQZ13P-2]|uniref:ABC transporter ATP-binding protein n=1 Tax=Phycicoccus mangrovi TaxID=2840470 RepID=UPI001BFFDC4E|nr:ABC transporter ATP-binding protein [Phycicoccus mangrovi]MBT9256637.1 ABC transporter ATP-binding protein/permease [Phycicoccus mangrovi]MBT9274799.1 ABC transporter ATP-binding protein/permease [Phycicoccus mangrovi]
MTAAPTQTPARPAARHDAGGRGGRGVLSVDPRDRARLEEAPVSLRRVLALFAPHRGRIAVVVGIIVVTSVVGLAQPFLVREVVDVAIPQQDVRLLVLAVAAMVTVAAVTQLLGVVQTWLSTQVGQRVMHGLRTTVFTHLQRQSLGFFTRTRGGEVQSRLVNDVGGMQGVVTSTATSIASNVTTAVATAVAMVALSWRLSLLSLLVVPPAIWLTRKVALMRREVTARQQRRLADLNAQIEEGLSVSGIRLAKTLGTTAHSARRFADTSEDLVGLELRAQLAGRWRMATMQIVFAVIPALVYLAAGLPATSGGMTIGTLVAFTALQGGIFRPLMGLLNVTAQWVASMALFSRVFEYLDLVPDVPAPTHPVPMDPAGVAGHVRVEGATVRYPGSARDAVSGVTLDVPAGSTLALVGPTGSGKSTVAGLLGRLLDPDAGRVTVDGVDVRDLDPDVLASVVGTVSQESYLVHATVRENLLLARPEATEAELWRALGAAQVADLVASLPEGLDTVVGARGHRFSGGEQQRLAVARTILRDPPVLVLDEATSALDTATERALQSALDELARGRTTVTIAHRLSTVRRADRIAVLDAGRVVESGTHDELLALGGRYADLVAAAEGAPATVPA